MFLVDPGDLGKRGDFEAIIAGPPCQSFSTAGNRGGTSDQRGLLLWQMHRFIKALQPEVFLVENVRGASKVLDLWASDLPRGYVADAFLVNAAGHGAPQLRERLLLIGSRLGRRATFPEATHGAGKLPFATLRDALLGLCEDSPTLLDFSPRKKEVLAQVPAGCNWRALLANVAHATMGRAYHAKGSRSGWWRRLSWDQPSPTILAMPNHASTSLCHPDETRVLSARECARVQGFPDDFSFHGTTIQQYAQIGNAVPILLGSLAANAMARLMLGEGEPVRRGQPRILVHDMGSTVRSRAWKQAA